MKTVNELDYLYRKLLVKAQEKRNNTIDITDEEYVKHYEVEPEPIEPEEPENPIINPDYVYECDYEIYEDENNDIILDLKSVNITDPRYENIMPWCGGYEQLSLGPNIINKYASRFSIYPYSYSVKYYYPYKDFIYIQTQSDAISLSNISQTFDGTFTLSHELTWYTYNTNYSTEIITLESFDDITGEFNFNEINSPICTHKGEQYPIHIQKIIKTVYNEYIIMYDNGDSRPLSIGHTDGVYDKRLDYNNNINIINTFNQITLYNFEYDEDTELNNDYILKGIYLSAYYVDNRYGNDGYGFRLLALTRNGKSYIFESNLNEYINHNSDYFAQLLDCQSSILTHNIKYTSITCIFNQSYIQCQLTPELLKTIIDYEKTFNFYICVNDKYLKFSIPYLGYIDNNKIYNYDGESFILQNPTQVEYNGVTYYIEQPECPGENYILKSYYYNDIYYYAWFETNKDITIYLKDPGWTDVYFYAWDGNININDTWPGVKITDTTVINDVTYYYRTLHIVDDPGYSLNVVFNIGSTNTQSTDVTGITDNIYCAITSYNGDGKYNVESSVSPFADILDFKNGDFEYWENNQPINWKSASSASNGILEQSIDAYTGNYSVKLKGETTANKRIAYQELLLTAGTYHISFYAKTVNNTEIGCIRPGYARIYNILTNNITYTYGEYVDVNNSWTQINWEFTLSKDMIICLVIMNSKTPGTDVLIDEYTIYEINQTIEQP